MEKKESNSILPRWVWAGALLALTVGIVITWTALNKSPDQEPPNVEPTPVSADDVGPTTPNKDAGPVEEQTTGTPVLELPATTAPAPATSTVESPTPVASPVDSPADLFTEEQARVEETVIEIRNLAPIVPVKHRMLNRDQLRQQLEEEFANSYSPEEARNDAIVLSAFDFLPWDFDIYNSSLDLLTEQIAAYYDTEADEFVLVDDDNEFGALDQISHAHEFVHALQDQHFSLGLLEEDSLDSEASFALRSLAEGEATLVQMQYMLEHMSLPELMQLLGESLGIETEVYNNAPAILSRQLEFPYLTGLEFVQALYDRGGYDAINEAWQNPPQSTEHIIHPDRYLSGDTPQVISLSPLTDTLGSGWRLLDEDILGEFYLREYLAQQLSSAEVDRAATGWGGDLYAVYWNEERQAIVLVLRIAWDSDIDGNEFAILYADYLSRLFEAKADSDPVGGLCWQGHDTICISALDRDTLIVRAPDRTLASAAAGIQKP
jgi:hypothetical protein